MPRDPHVELALRACDGDELAFARLVREMGAAILSAVWGIRFPGAALEDVRQEALLGLHKATVDFDPAARVPFEAFARLVMRRQVLTMLTNATRGKQAVLSHALEIDRPVPSTDGEIALAEFLATGEPGPLEVLLAREQAQEIVAALRWLTSFERRVLMGRAAGMSYDELGPRKSVDNALQRARRKIAAALAA